MLWPEAEALTSHDCLADVQAATNVQPQGSLKGRAVVRPLVAPMHRAGSLHGPALAFSICALLNPQRRAFRTHSVYAFSCAQDRGSPARHV